MDRSTPRTGPRETGRLAVLLALLAASADRAAAAEPASPLVAAEARFAAAVTANGVRAGFLAFLADSSVSFVPEPRPARPLFERLADDGSRLDWRPDVATLSAGGDFGWTSGPYLADRGGTSGAPEAGHFLTVWRRDPAAGWQVLLDAGSDYPLPPDRRDRHLAVEARLRPGGHAVAADAPDCDSRFIEQWQHRGRRRALTEFAAGDVRLLGPGMAPLDGVGATERDPLAGVPLAAARIARRLKSASGDIVIAYGEYDYAATAARPRGRETFALAFDAGRGCRLALELRVPAGSPGTP